jgi:6-phosphofructokinase 1
MKNVIIAQSGGPTCVINSSLRGVIEAAREFGNVGTVYGGCHGIEGVLKEELLDLTAQPEEEIALLRYTPVAGSIGTCRYKLKSHQKEDFERSSTFSKHITSAIFFTTAATIRWIPPTKLHNSHSSGGLI